jgi:hypothetical protein
VSKLDRTERLTQLQSLAHAHAFEATFCSVCSIGLALEVARENEMMILLQNDHDFLNLRVPLFTVLIRPARTTLINFSCGAQVTS